MQIVEQDLDGGRAPGIRPRRANDIHFAAVVPNMELHVGAGRILCGAIGLHFNGEIDRGVPDEVAGIGRAGA